MPQAKGVSTKQWSENHRKKIRDANILGRLVQFAKGDIEMSRERLKAHEILLRKIMPDLSAADLTTKGDSISFNFTVKKK